VSGAALGNHRSIAIEASGCNVTELAANAHLNADRFEVLHAAVAEQDGGMVTLGGPTHEGLAIIDAAQAAPGAETVQCMSLDGILSRTPWLDQAKQLVLKLDVEGVEEAALRGSSQMLNRDTLLIYEEQGSDTHHGNTRYVTGKLGMTLFTFQNGRFVEAPDAISTVAAMKTNRRRGYNVVATRSAYWLDRLRAG
jgi:FkbM family methyltransferase